MDDIKFITLTNDGYLNYTLNLIESLKNINFDLNIITFYCIGNKSYNTLKNKNLNVFRIDDNNAINLKTYGSNGWGDVLKYKTYIIHENLKNHKYVCITDGDIVYENNKFLEYCFSNLNTHKSDMICQYDGINIKPNKNDTICCGFMFIKSTEKTQELFNYNSLINIKGDWKEQPYINRKIKLLKIKVTLLDRMLFPNGYIYYNYNDKIYTPYLIHFNWVVGDEKIKKMKLHEKWYLNDT